jgi:hypothetical protein
MSHRLLRGEVVVKDVRGVSHYGVEEFDVSSSLQF